VATISYHAISGCFLPILPASAGYNGYGQIVATNASKRFSSSSSIFSSKRKEKIISKHFVAAA